MNYEIGSRIRKYREANNITQKELAQKIGVSSSRVSNWEQGLYRPDVDILANIWYPINKPTSKESDLVYRPYQTLLGILQYSGKSSDHGSILIRCCLLGFSPSFGSSLKRYIKYPNTSNLLSFAHSIIVKHNALASAPLEVSLNRKFFLAITNGFTARSALLFVSSSRPSARKPSSSFLLFRE